MRIAGDILKIIFGVLVGAALVGFFGINLHFIGVGANVSDVAISYTDLAVINLTAATVALGAVAVVVTIAAVFGFQVIRAASIAAAETRVEGDLPILLTRELGEMEKDGRLTDALERAIYSGGSEDKKDEDPQA